MDNNSVGPQNEIPLAPRTTTNPLTGDDQFGSRFPEMTESIKLEKCIHCGRSFASNRIEIHTKVCAKRVQAPKRSVWDSSKQRLSGTDAEPFARKAKPVERPKSNWKKNHEDLIEAIRAARRAHAHIARGGAPADLPPPPPTTNPDYIQCPHCGRRFNEIAAAKHIPLCAKSTHNTIRLSE
ncbi:unnamed protein product [Allacma fusca]|uniref:C2HC/C3H-type domain-containing protein n=1 Tax=Allacma fusca TaxID=39272 RepID=A0A8J2JS75_9HEXA|nr:unnamed protein product [Allacma fusca]